MLSKGNWIVQLSQNLLQLILMKIYELMVFHSLDMRMQQLIMKFLYIVQGYTINKKTLKGIKQSYFKKIVGIEVSLCRICIKNVSYDVRFFSTQERGSQTFQIQVQNKIFDVFFHLLQINLSFLHPASLLKILALVIISFLILYFDIL